MPGPVRVTPEERAAALDRYVALGLAGAHAETGIPKATLRRWAHDAGIDTAAIAGASIQQTEAATAEREVRIAGMTAELREEFASVALDLLERTRLPHTVASEKVAYDRPPAGACRDYVIAAAVAVDKLQLLSGNATSKTEVVTGVAESTLQVRNLRDDLKKVKDRRALAAKQAAAAVAEQSSMAEIEAAQ